MTTKSQLPPFHMSGTGVKQVETPTEAASMYDLRSWRCEAPCFAEQVSRRRNIGQYAEKRAKRWSGSYLAEMEAACHQTSCAAQISFKKVQRWTVATVLSLP